MTAGEWERIKALFDAALQLPEHEREPYLNGACAGRPDLRCVVDELLQNLAEAGGFLEEHTGSRCDPPVFSLNQLVANRFRIIRLIAAGGMGEVYEVFDERLRLRVALKTIRMELVSSREAFERFKREVWITREVSHEGICRIYELIEHHDPSDGRTVPCITMKLLEGHDLHAELRRRGPLPLEEALEIATRICEALEVLHSQGIIHRDLKPSNIMLVPMSNGARRVVLTDFGLARRLDQTTLTMTEGTGQQPGAPFYLAPEVLKGNRESVASDIYALGLVIDEMVTNSRAFTAESIHALYWQKLWEDPIPPHARAPGLPSYWNRTILKCLAMEPSARYSSPQAVVDALQTGDVEEPGPLAVIPPRKALRSLLARRAMLLLLTLVPLFSALAVLPELVLSPAKATILISPIANGTGHTEFDYALKGTVAEVARRLNRVDRFRAYLTSDSGVDKVAANDAVVFRLRGELQMVGSEARLLAQLVDDRNGKPIWEGTLQEELSDPLRLESSISMGVAKVLRETAGGYHGAIPGGAKAMQAADSVMEIFRRSRYGLPPPATESATAFNAYLKGQAQASHRNRKSALAARELFEQAVGDDPDFALAWAAMADAQRVLMEFDHGERGDLLPKAVEYAQRAVAADPALPEAQATLGAVMQVAWQWEKAQQAYQTALELHPGFARGHRSYGGMLLQFGRFESGLAQFRKALELDPFDYASLSAYGFCLFYAGRPQHAAEHLEHALQKHDNIGLHINLGQVYAHLAGISQGEKSEEYETRALREAGTLRKLETLQAGKTVREETLKWSNLIYAVTYGYRGKAAQARPWVELLEKGRRMGEISPITVACARAALKEYDSALDLLEMAAAYHERELTNLKISPYFKALHGHPRYITLLRAINLPRD